MNGIIQWICVHCKRCFIIQLLSRHPPKKLHHVKQVLQTLKNYEKCLSISRSFFLFVFSKNFLWGQNTLILHLCLENQNMLRSTVTVLVLSCFVLAVAGFPYLHRKKIKRDYSIKLLMIFRFALFIWKKHYLHR